MNLNAETRVCYLTNNCHEDLILKEFACNNIHAVAMGHDEDVVSHLSKYPCDMFVIDPRVDSETVDVLRKLLKQSFDFKKVLQLDFYEIETSDISRVLEELSLQTQTEYQCMTNRLELLNKEVGESLTRLLVELFIGKMEEYIHNFGCLVKNKDQNGICYEAHNLKSASANLGMSQISKHCGYLEKNHSFYNEEMMRVHLTEIIFQYNKASSILLAYLNKSS